MQARVPNFAVKLNGKKTAGDLIAKKSALAAVAASNTSTITSIHQQQKQNEKVSPDVDMKKSQSNGYLNSLFSQSSNLFGGKKLRDRNKKIDRVTPSGFYYHTSLGT